MVIGRGNAPVLTGWGYLQDVHTQRWQYLQSSTLTENRDAHPSPDKLQQMLSRAPLQPQVFCNF